MATPASSSSSAAKSLSPLQTTTLTPSSTPQIQSPPPMSSSASSFSLMVIAQHGNSSPNYVRILTSRIDFPGTGDDEISFKRGETIVVMAKDDGFGDGWWTVSLPSQYSPILICFPAAQRFSYMLLGRMHFGWSGGQQEAKGSAHGSSMIIY
jgi:hypothetical protein